MTQTLLDLNIAQKVSALFTESEARFECWAKLANRVKMARRQGYRWIRRQNLAHICPFPFAPYRVRELYFPKNRISEFWSFWHKRRHSTTYCTKSGELITRLKIKLEGSNFAGTLTC